MKNLVSLLFACALLVATSLAHATHLIGSSAAKRFVTQALKKEKGITNYKVTLVKQSPGLSHFVATVKHPKPYVRYISFSGSVDLSKGKNAPKGTDRVQFLGD